MLTAAAPTFGVLVGMRALLGFGQAITEPSSASLLSDYYPTSQRGRVFSNQQVMVFIGFGLGIALGGAIGSEFGLAGRVPRRRPAEPRRRGPRVHVEGTEARRRRSHARRRERRDRRRRSRARASCSTAASVSSCAT